jgi:hypothetical protein
VALPKVQVEFGASRVNASRNFALSLGVAH